MAGSSLHNNKQFDVQVCWVYRRFSNFNIKMSEQQQSICSELSQVLKVLYCNRIRKFDAIQEFREIVMILEIKSRHHAFRCVYCEESIETWLHGYYKSGKRGELVRHIDSNKFQDDPFDLNVPL